MSKNQMDESETLDEKIKRIRKKNEEIEKRRLEVEADKQTAAKLNALVQLSAPKEDWPPPRTYISEEDTGRPSLNAQEKNRERNRGKVTFDSSLYEGKRPPPDPAYKFLADAERDPVPNKSSSKHQQVSRGRSSAVPRSRGRGYKTNVRENLSLNERGSPGYEAWRAERNRIDEERIQRQRTAQGQWRREWDNQKSEDDWQSPNNEARKEQNSAQIRITSLNAPSELTQRKFMPHSKGYEEEHTKDSGNKKTGRSAADLSPDLQEESLSSNTKKPKSTMSSNVFSNIQNSGNMLHVSFVNDACTQKASSRRHVTGSGRLGVPPVGPRRSSGSEGSPGPLPQRRVRGARPRRRAAATPQRKVSTGDDSWEDADEPSEAEGDPATTTTAKVTADGQEKAAVASELLQVSCSLAINQSNCTSPEVTSLVNASDNNHISLHSDDALTVSLSSRPPVEQQNFDFPLESFDENAPPESSSDVVEKYIYENSGDKRETGNAESVESDSKYTLENTKNKGNQLLLCPKDLESVDKPASSKEENLESPALNSGSLKNDSKDVTHVFNSFDDSLERTANCGIITVENSANVNENRESHLEKNLSIEKFHVCPESSTIPEGNKMLVQNEVEYVTENVISLKSPVYDLSKNSKLHETNCEEVSSESTVNIMESKDCSITCTKPGEQITHIIGTSNTTCSFSKCSNVSNKENLEMDGNFTIAENKDISTNFIDDMSRNLINVSEARQNSSMSDDVQFTQSDCSSELSVNILLGKVTQTELSCESLPDFPQNTDVQLFSEPDNPKISKNIVENLERFESKENIVSNS